MCIAQPQTACDAYTSIASTCVPTSVRGQHGQRLRGPWVAEAGLLVHVFCKHCHEQPMTFMTHVTARLALSQLDIGTFEIRLVLLYLLQQSFTSLRSALTASSLREPEDCSARLQARLENIRACPHTAYTSL